ncbi:MAG TPA: hypothetical protein VGY55_15005 [Pirellulales bacterium]|jgi:hypothetical protein|nr:hypothetical protein [Pirellulales bacterium]
MDDDRFFLELKRGQRPLGLLSTQNDRLHRNPADLERASRQVKYLMDHALDKVGDCVDTINNILRWHGPDEIKNGLQRHGRGQLDLLARLRALVDDSTGPAE